MFIRRLSLHLPYLVIRLLAVPNVEVVSEDVVHEFPSEWSVTAKQTAKTIQVWREMHKSRITHTRIWSI